MVTVCAYHSAKQRGILYQLWVTSGIQGSITAIQVFHNLPHRVTSPAQEFCTSHANNVQAASATRVRVKGTYGCSIKHDKFEMIGDD